MIKIYNPDSSALCKNIIENKIIAKLSQRELNIAISGGSTPKILFELMASDEYINRIDWAKLNIFWVDERMLPPDHKDSNYRMTKEAMLDKVPIPKENIHRIMGENDLIEEEKRYNELVLSRLESKNNFPIFDIVFLGIGDDGHTSSIFPTEMHLLSSNKAYEIATNPYNKQKRIALTGNAILQGKEIIFLATGEAKRNILMDLSLNNEKAKTYPSNYILENRLDAVLYTDVDF